MAALPSVQSATVRVNSNVTGIARGSRNHTKIMPNGRKGGNIMSVGIDDQFGMLGMFMLSRLVLSVVFPMLKYLVVKMEQILELEKQLRTDIEAM